MSLDFRQLLSMLLSGGCAPTVCSLTLQQDSGEPWQKHRGFTSHSLLNYLWVNAVGNLLLLLIFYDPEFGNASHSLRSGGVARLVLVVVESIMVGEKSCCGQATSVGSSYKAGVDWPFIKTSRVQVKQAAGPRDCRPPVLIDLALLDFLI